MRRFVRNLLLVVFLVSFAGTSHAEFIDYYFSGSVLDVHSPYVSNGDYFREINDPYDTYGTDLYQGISIGDSWSAIYSFDTNTRDTVSNPYNGMYDNAINSISLKIGEKTILNNYIPQSSVINVVTSQYTPNPGYSPPYGNDAYAAVVYNREYNDSGLNTRDAFRTFDVQLQSNQVGSAQYSDQYAFKSDRLLFSGDIPRDTRDNDLGISGVFPLASASVSTFFGGFISLAINQHRSTQMVYLNFDESTSDVNVGGKPVSYDKAAANLTETQKDQIVEKFNDIYGDFLIKATKTKPTTGSYSTVEIGGTSMAAIGDEKQRNTGIADLIDWYNFDMNDKAHVFSDNLFFKVNNDNEPLNSEVISLRVAQVAAHEAGHIFGLQHVNKRTELMEPRTSYINTKISDEFIEYGFINWAEFLSGNGDILNGGGVFNHYQGLASNIGVKDISLPVEKLLYTKRVIGFEAWDILGTSYNTQYVLVSGAEDVAPMYFDLGDISSGSSVSISVAPGIYAGAYILGSSTQGGPTDIFGTSRHIDFLDPGLSVLENFLMPFADVNSFNLYKVNGDVFDNIGTSSLRILNPASPSGMTPVPEPSTLILQLVGLIALALFRFRKSLLRRLDKGPKGTFYIPPVKKK